MINHSKCRTSLYRALANGNSSSLKTLSLAIEKIILLEKSTSIDPSGVDTTFKAALLSNFSRLIEQRRLTLAGDQPSACKFFKLIDAKTVALVGPCGDIAKSQSQIEAHEVVVRLNNPARLSASSAPKMRVNVVYFNGEKVKNFCKIIKCFHNL